MKGRRGNRWLKIVEIFLTSGCRRCFWTIRKMTLTSMGIISKQEFFLGLQRQKKLAKLQDSAFSLWKLFSGCLASVPYKTNKLNFRVSEWRQGVCWTCQLLSFYLTVLFLFWIVVCNLQTGRDRLQYSLFHISISSKFLLGLSSGCFSCVSISTGL